MVMQRAAQIPFRPELCPQCRHYYEELNRCRAFSTESWPRPILGVFSGEAQGACSRYERAAEKARVALRNKAPVLPTPEVSQSTAAAEESEAPATPTEGLAKCPQCDQGIAELAEICPQCGAQIEVRLEGYCTACHAIVSLNDQVKCRRCGAKAMDIQVKRKLVAGSAGKSEQSFPTQAMSQPVIYCHKCKAENSPAQVRCVSCKTDLLPGEGFGARVAYLIGSLILAAVFGFITYASLTNPESAVAICPSPVESGIFTLIALVTGLALAFRKTPLHTRYANRAERHIESSPRQALADISTALELSPQKERAEMLKKRIKIYQKLALEDEATRDLIAYTYEPGAYQWGARISSLFGADSDAYTLSAASGERKRLVESGKVIGLGYCQRCKEVVQLTPKLRCQTHPRTKPGAVQLVLPAEYEAGVQAVLAERKRAQNERNRKLVLAVAGLFIVCTGIYLLTTRLDKPAEQLPADKVAVTPSQMAVPEPEVTQITFDEHGIVFEYPSDWMTINEAEVDTLVRTSLKGIGDYEYIGGVYIGDVSECADCAQMVIVVIESPVQGPISQDQYQQIKEQAQSQMGTRLITHRLTEVQEVPAVETVHIGKSKGTQLWDLTILPPGENKMYMFSCSATKSAYPDFEAIFAHGIETFRLETLGEQVMPTSEPTAIQSQAEAATVAVVNQTSIKVRSGPGTSYSVIGGLVLNQEVRVLGRNEAADWLRVEAGDGLIGWVFGELVDCSVPVETLPVDGGEP